MRGFIAILWLLGIAGLTVCVKAHVGSYVVASPDEAFPSRAIVLGVLPLVGATVIVCLFRWRKPSRRMARCLEAVFAAFLIYALLCFAFLPSDGHFEWRAGGSGAIVNGGRVVRMLSPEDAVRTYKAITRSQSAHLMLFYGVVVIGASLAFRGVSGERQNGTPPSEKAESDAA